MVTNYLANTATCYNDSNNYLNWDKASQENIQSYKTLLDSYLNNFSIPETVLTCSDFSCKDHNDTIMDKLEDFMDILILCANESIPSRKATNKPGIPGWNSFVQPFKDKSIFWHNVWKNAGSPPVGQLAEYRKFARSKYHWAIKQAKRDADEIIMNKTAESLYTKSFKQFWQTIKSINGSDKSMANVVDGENMDSKIASNFRDTYSNLYNSVEDEMLQSTIQKVECLTNSSCNSGSCVKSNCHTIKSDTVRNAINSLNCGKDDEICDISSDHFINGTEIMFIKLSQLITCMLRHGCSSQLINKAVIKPIPKDKKKSLSDSKNYRAIAKNTIISKIIDNIILSLVSNELSTSDYQFAYKKNFSTTLCSFLVAETIQYYKSLGSNVYMLSLDASKAFDRVQYSKLFNDLIEKEICPLIIRFIMIAYLNSSAVVSWNGTKSESFTLSNGVKQGGIISAPLFAMYIDPLLYKLQKYGKGCNIGNLCANSFAYADDIVLLSPSCTALKGLVNICEIFARDTKMKFNPEKCTLLIFSKNPNFYVNNIKIILDGCEIKNVLNEKHLGHNFDASFVNSFNLINFQNVTNDLKVRTNAIINNFRPISWQAKVKLFNSQCSSLYGSQLWRLDDKNVANLCTTWKVCCRKILGLQQRTRSWLIPHLMDSMEINDIIMFRMLNFIISGLNHNSDIITRFFKNMLLSNSSYMLTNLNKILNSFNLKYCDIFVMDKLQLKKHVQMRKDEPDWRVKTTKELLSIRDSQMTCILENNETQELLDFLTQER